MYFYLVNKDIIIIIIIIIVIVIIIKTINGKSYKNIESYKISNINVSRTAAIIRRYRYYYYFSNSSIAIELTVCPEREPQYKVELRLRNVVLRLRITARDWFKHFWLIDDLHCKGFLCVISETDHCAHSTRPFFLAVLI